jgi:hypothetical protein
VVLVFVFCLVGWSALFRDLHVSEDLSASPTPTDRLFSPDHVWVLATTTQASTSESFCTEIQSVEGPVHPSKLKVSWLYRLKKLGIPCNELDM